MKLLSVPTFAKTRSIVLLDLETLESYELKLGRPYQVVPSSQNETPAASASMQTQ